MTQLAQPSKLIEVNRDRLYHNQFLFKVTFSVPGTRFSRKTADINEVKEAVLRCQTIEIDEAKATRKPGHYTFLLETEINNIDWLLLEKYINWREFHIVNQSIKVLETYSGKVTVYINDPSLMTFSIPEMVWYKATPIIPKGTMWLKSPKHKYRVYFKEQTLTIQDKIKFEEFVRENIAELFPSKQTKIWLNRVNFPQTWTSKYCKSSFFIEYDEPKFLLVMKIKFGSLLGKEYKLEKIPE